MLDHLEADRLAARLACETGWYLSPDGQAAVAQLTDYVEADDNPYGANLIGVLRAARVAGHREASTDIDRVRLGRLEGATRMASIVLAGTTSTDETRQIAAALGDLTAGHNQAGPTTEEGA